MASFVCTAESCSKWVTMHVNTNKVFALGVRECVFQAAVGVVVNIK